MIKEMSVDKLAKKMSAEAKKNGVRLSAESCAEDLCRWIKKPDLAAIDEFSVPLQVEIHEFIANARGRSRAKAGAHRAPKDLLKDAIQRSLGWASETELRDLVQQRTGKKLSLGEANRFSQEVAEIVIKGLAIA